MKEGVTIQTLTFMVDELKYFGKHFEEFSYEDYLNDIKKDWLGRDWGVKTVLKKKKGYNKDEGKEKKTQIETT